MADKLSRMKELIRLLQNASKAYYAGDEEILSNFEYDRLYDELLKLEEETGTVMADSPTQKVGYEAVDFLPKETHEQPMLSLDKTKDRAALAAFAGGQRTLLSWKMDGLTVVLTYENGMLTKGVTRGNGLIGEVVTGNVRAFQNVPLTIPFTGNLVLRGEAVIGYKDFERINASLPEGEKPYKNPRNLCSGAVRQLDSAVTASRAVSFYAFSLVTAEGMVFENSHEKELLFLKRLGFDIVQYAVVTGNTMEGAIARFEAMLPDNDFPSDGLVALYDDIAYGRSLGATAKFPRNAMAFKWQDETAETTLHEVEWSASRTGRINPVAIFEPVELEGTTVSRASVHNVSIVKSLRLGIGDRLLVYKANMIIPQIAENLTGSGSLPIPDRCPVCGEMTTILREGTETDGVVETLFCPNPSCQAKKILSYELFVSRDGLNIEGLSEATLEKLIAEGFLRRRGDLFRLKDHREKIETMEGFGSKSFEKLTAAIEAARKTTLSRLLTALGIPGVGTQTSKLLAKAFHEDLAAIQNASEEELLSIETIGPVVASSVRSYFSEEENCKELLDILSFLTIEKSAGQQSASLAGKAFVITGSLVHFPNRQELVSFIEAHGGKTQSAVSAKTDYLINNNKASTSGKNKKASELGIPVLSEDDFLKLAGE